MKAVLKKRYRALTLIEIMVAIVVIVVAVIGAMGFRYHCALDARKADVQITAARVGLLLLEGWKGMGGLSVSDPNNNYDPGELSFNPELQISSGSGPAEPGGFTSFGSYKVDAGGAYYYATLSHKGLADEMRALNVMVAWPIDYPTGDFADTSQLITLTTYTN